MFRTFATALIFAVALAHVSLAQDLNAYMQNQLNQTDARMQQYYQQMNQLDYQMQQAQNQIVNQNMNNPAVQQMFQQYQNAGSPYGQMTYEQFAYAYAATGGFSAQGMENYNRTTREINARDSAAQRDYQNYVNNLWSSTNQYRSEVYDRQQRDFGDLMTGSTWYGNSGDGQRYYLPYTAQQGQMYTDGYGRTFMVDAGGNYQMVDANGNQSYLNPVWNR